MSPKSASVRCGGRSPTRCAAIPRSRCRAAPADLGEVYGEFSELIAPYATGNVHPGFMGWVHGGGTPVGMLAEMLAAGLNANLRRARPHADRGRAADRANGCGSCSAFPRRASGMFVTGTSMANLHGRAGGAHRALGTEVRQRGLAGRRRLTAYTSAAAHGCVAQAMDLAGLGRDALRRIPPIARHRIDLEALRARDRGGPRRRASSRSW